MSSATHHPRSPSLTHTKESRLLPTERPAWRKEQTLVRQNAYRPHKVWKGMHHPEWGRSNIAHREPAHQEEDAFILSGEYWIYPNNNGLLNTLATMKDGDEFIMEPRTAIGKNGRLLKKAKPLGYLRKGIISAAPIIARQNFDNVKDWYVIRIDWSPTHYHKDPKYKNTGQRAICEQ
jgi:hypothetical protein